MVRVQAIRTHQILGLVRVALTALLLGLGSSASAQSSSGNPAGTNLPDQARVVREIAERFKGTHDLAGAAEALVNAAGNQFVYSYGVAGDPLRGDFTMPRTADDLFGQRLMICYEFVHYVAFLTGPQLTSTGQGVAIYGVAGSAYDTPTAVVWDGTSEIPRGKLIVFIAPFWNNTSGYYHIGISLGNGLIAHNSSAGNVQISKLSDINSIFYWKVLIADYKFNQVGEQPAGSAQTTGPNVTPPTSSPPVMNSPPPPTPARPPVTNSPPPAATPAPATGCPECDGIVRDIALTQAGIDELDARLADLRAKLSQNQAEQRTTSTDIAALQAQINDQANRGVGGSGYDPATGLTTTATAQAGGTVLITVTDSSGATVSQRTRPQTSVADAQAALAAKQQQLAALKSAEGDLNTRIATAEARRAQLQTDLARLQEALARCLAACRHRTVALPGGPQPNPSPQPSPVDDPDLTEPVPPCPEAADACAGAQADFAAAVRAYVDARTAFDDAVQQAADAAKALTEAATAFATIAMSQPPGSPAYVAAANALAQAQAAANAATSVQTQALRKLATARANAVKARAALVDCYRQALERCKKPAIPGGSTAPAPKPNGNATQDGSGVAGGDGNSPPGGGNGSRSTPGSDDSFMPEFSCPECEPWARSVAEYRRELANLAQRETATKAALAGVQAQEKAAQQRIDALNALLADQQGTGGSGTDPQTGLTTTSVTRADGQVEVTVRDANGNVVAGPTLRSRSDVASAQADANQAASELASLRAQEASLNSDLNWIATRRATVNRMLQTALDGLAECEKKCREKHQALIGSAIHCLELASCMDTGALAGVAGGGVGDPGDAEELSSDQLFVAADPADAGSENDAGNSTEQPENARNWTYPAFESGAAQDRLERGDLVYARAVAAPARSAGPVIAFIATGRSTGEAFTLEVRDPSGRIKSVAVPEGLVLQPIAVSPALHASMLDGAPDVRAAHSGFCIEFRKDVPPPGTVYRVAGLAMQQRFRPLHQILAAGRMLAAKGQLHPDSDPKGYVEGIRQYALWAYLEHWDQQQFAAALMARTQKNALQLRVRWTGEMSKAIEAAVPGRWRDINAVLSAAGASAEQRASPARTH